MEGCQYERQLGGVLEEFGIAYHLFLHVDIIAHESATHVNKWLEDKQHPAYAEQVEEHVGKRRSPCLRVSGHCCQVGSHGGTDILAHHQSDTLIYRQYATRTEDHRYSHHCC